MRAQEGGHMYELESGLGLGHHPTHTRPPTQTHAHTHSPRAQDHLYELEGELGLDAASNVLFVVYEDDREKKWRVQVRTRACACVCVCVCQRGGGLNRERGAQP